MDHSLWCPLLSFTLLTRRLYELIEVILDNKITGAKIYPLFFTSISRSRFLPCSWVRLSRLILPPPPCLVSVSLCFVYVSPSPLSPSKSSALIDLPKDLPRSTPNPIHPSNSLSLAHMIHWVRILNLEKCHGPPYWLVRINFFVAMMISRRPINKAWK